MGRLWTLIIHVHALAGPVMMLLYPLYASVIAIESPSKVDDQQWLAYWILYSFLTLAEMLLQSFLEWIPIWYDVKLALVAWLVLPQFRGAAFIYERFVREKLMMKYGKAKDKSPNGKAKDKSPNGKAKDKSPNGKAKNKSPNGNAKNNSANGKAKNKSPNGNAKNNSPNGKAKNKFVNFIIPKKGEHEAY